MLLTCVKLVSMMLGYCYALANMFWMVFKNVAHPKLFLSC